MPIDSTCTPSPRTERALARLGAARAVALLFSRPSTTRSPPGAPSTTSPPRPAANRAARTSSDSARSAATTPLTGRYRVFLLALLHDRGAYRAPQRPRRRRRRLNRVLRTNYEPSRHPVVPHFVLESLRGQQFTVPE